MVSMKTKGLGSFFFDHLKHILPAKMSAVLLLLPYKRGTGPYVPEGKGQAEGSD